MDPAVRLRLWEICVLFARKVYTLGQQLRFALLTKRKTRERNADLGLLVISFQRKKICPPFYDPEQGLFVYCKKTIRNLKQVTAITTIIAVFDVICTRSMNSVSSAFFKVDTIFRCLHDNDLRFQGSLFLYTNRSTRGNFK